jgi:hypothetical protein
MAAAVGGGAAVVAATVAGRASTSHEVAGNPRSTILGSTLRAVILVVPLHPAVTPLRRLTQGSNWMEAARVDADPLVPPLLHARSVGAQKEKMMMP